MGLRFWFVLPVILAILSSAVSLLIILIRLRYPFELEWIEGAYLDQARWVASGNPLFAAPLINFIPTNKTPVFFLVSAIFIKLFGDGFLAVRLVSALAVLGTVILLGVMVYKDSGRWSASILSMGLYLASFRFTGSWMDLGKTDSLFLFWILLGFYWQRKYVEKKQGYFILMALAYVLAYYTKQLALPTLIVMAVISLFISRLASWKEWLLTVVLGVGVFMVLDQITQGWFSFYTFDTTIHHQVEQAMLLDFWKKVLPLWWPTLLLVGLYAGRMLWKIQRKEVSFQSFALLMSFCLGLLAASWSVFLKVWTYDNDLMPIALGSALMGGLAYGEYANWYQQFQGRKQTFYWGAIVLMLAAQFFLWRYNPLRQLPTQQDASLGQEFVEHIASLEGDVWVFNHGFYTALAGKPTFIHSSPFGDVAGVVSPDELPEDTAERRNQVLQVVNEAVEGQRFSWIFVDKYPQNWLPYYVLAEQFFTGKDGLFPVTGAPSRSEYGLMRNPVVYGGEYPVNSSFVSTFFTEGWILSDMGRRQLQDQQGTISIALLPEQPYSLDLHVIPQCIENISVVKNISLYWNDYFLAEIPITACGDISLHEIFLPGYAISGDLDTLQINTTLMDNNRHNPENWTIELKSITFQMTEATP